MAGQNIGESTVLVSYRMLTDPVSGQVSVEQVYDGAESAIYTLRDSVVASGGRATVSQDGGINRLTVSWSRDPDASELDEVPSDTWDDETQTEIIDPFSTSAALAEAYSYSQAGNEFANYKKLIEDAVKDGEGFPFDTATYPVGYNIYTITSRGVKGIPISRPILTRRRTFSTTYSGRNQLEFVQKVWTQDALIAAFEIPAAVQNRLPTVPERTAAQVAFGEYWGWKLEVDSSSYSVRDNKVAETKSWVFASWLESLYTIVTA